MLDQLGWERSSIDILVAVSQTHDYQLPSNGLRVARAYGLVGQLRRLRRFLGAFGLRLWALVGQFFAVGRIGETRSAGGGRNRAANLFSRGPWDSISFRGFWHCNRAGDGTTKPAPCTSYWVLTAAGRATSIVPGGGARNPVSESSLERIPGGDGYLRNELDLSMNGAEVFSFTLKRVPQLFKDVLQLAGWDLSDVDAVVRHQANLFMLKHLAKSMKIPLDKLVLSLEDFGNTSSASIPLTVSLPAGFNTEHQPDEVAYGRVRRGLELGSCGRYVRANGSASRCGSCRRGNGGCWPMNPLDLTGKTIMVTGASNGIGRSTSVYLSRLGARIVAVGRNQARLDETLAALERNQHRSYAIDLADVEPLPAWMRTVAADVGPLYGLVHSAGMVSESSFEGADLLRLFRDSCASISMLP